MTLRTILILVGLDCYLAIPHGLYDALREDGYPVWVLLVSFIIFTAPALLLAWWLIDRKRSL